MAQASDDLTAAELGQRLAELERRNAELTAQLEQRSASKLRPGRTVLAFILIFIGALLTPVSITATWFASTIANTDLFVAAYAPLIKDPEVQAFLADEVSNAIDQRIDIESLVDELIAALDQKVERPTSKAALAALRQPLIEGTKSTIHSAAAKVIASDEFEKAWEASLRLSHAELTGALAGNPDTALTISRDGLGLQLAPMISKVRDVLVEQGYTFASAIPVIDRTVMLVPSDTLVAAQVGYRSVLMASYWLGPVALAFLTAGVLVSRRRALALIWAAIALGLGATVVLAAETLLRLAAQVKVPLPLDVVSVFYDAAFVPLREIALAPLALAVVIIVIACLVGPFAWSVKLRSGYAKATAWLRGRVESAGFSTGKYGEWLFGQRILVRVVIGGLGVVWLIATRPISVSSVTWTAFWVALVIFVLSLLQRPTSDSDATTQDSADDSSTDPKDLSTAL
jgi:hypothetical protein